MKKLSPKAVVFVKTQITKIEESKKTRGTDDLIEKILEKIKECLLMKSFDDLVGSCGEMKEELQIKEMKIKKFLNGLNSNERLKIENKLDLLIKTKELLNLILKYLNTYQMNTQSNVSLF